MEIKWKPVANFSKGRFGHSPQAIVIHIAEGYLAGGYSWFNNSSSQASSHYMIGKNGEIWQFVKDEDTAWHAGGASNPTWSKLKPGINPNLYTIGIEHEGFTGEKWTDAMKNSSAYLISQLSSKFNLSINRTTVIGHYEINSTSRINCPGKGIDLNELVNLSLNLLEDPKMISQLNEKIASLEAQINNLNEKNVILNKTIENIKSEYLSLEATYQSLLKTKTATESVTLLTQENSRLRTEIKRLQQLSTTPTQPETKTAPAEEKTLLDKFFNLFMVKK